MQPLNYCRSFAKQLRTYMEIPTLAQRRTEFLSGLDMIQASTKFCVPEGGQFFASERIVGIDPTEPLHLPYRMVALEFRPTGSKNQLIIFAREHEDSDRIYITGACREDSDATWWMPGQIFLEKVGAFDIAAEGHLSAVRWKYIGDDRNEAFARDATRVLLGLCNALACSNVSATRLPAKKGNVKSALPFDVYHVLVVDTRAGGEGGASGASHRSPREHLRRGHIRRLQDGRRLWINATVVAAGRGAGVVSKDYALRAA